MLDTKDPAIKLFGQTIPLPADGESPAFSGDDFIGEGSGSTGCEDPDHEEEEKKESGREEDEIEEEKDLQVSKPTKNGQQSDVQVQPQISEESMNAETSLEPNENPKKRVIDEQSAASRTPKTRNEKDEKSNSREKTLKKPDKILPCPRCNSMETKFCYFNNYNVNQPRHFCKNCQRYWTNGGTMRNVPVGAGRRKSNKNSIPHHYHYIAISEALHESQINAPNGNNSPKLKTNGTVLSFGSDAPLSESMASVLNIGEKTMWSGVKNGVCEPQQSEFPIISKVGENGDDHHSSGSSTTTNTNSIEETSKTCTQESSTQAFHGFTSQVPWPYQWNVAIPMFYPASYWNCTFPGTWPVPLLSSPSSSQNTSSSSPNSSTLGKHLRDGNMLEPRSLGEVEDLRKQKGSERNIWVPKTLRIDDPEEAAKSSIWATLGIKNESIGKGGFFKGFQRKGDLKNHANETSSALCANPAALSRSLNFHESS